MNLKCLAFVFIAFLHSAYSVKPVKAPKASIVRKSLKVGESFQVSSENYGKEGKKYGTDEDNQVVFTGEGSCSPQIRCDHLDIQPQCDREYVMISDDTFSYKVLCGSTPMKNWLKVSNKVLTVKFRTSSVAPKEPKAGFKCTVECPAQCNGGVVDPVTPTPEKGCQGADTVYICHINATCSTRKQRCLCNTGFAGDGELCGVDTDKDGSPDEKLKCKAKMQGKYKPRCDKDNCLLIPNSGQEDMDGDGTGDGCDEDRDNDNILDFQKSNDSDLHLVPLDNCIQKQNTDQKDADGDGLGDLCDMCEKNPDPKCICEGKKCLEMDTDDDGLHDGEDNCPNDKNKDQADKDKDTKGDACDNCPNIPNKDQKDTDMDFVGDVCDNNIDLDRDGVQDNMDNCPKKYNADQLDTDVDGKGDICDDDKDNDGIKNEKDNCELVPNADQRKDPNNMRKRRSRNRMAENKKLGDACVDNCDGSDLEDLDDICKCRKDVDLVTFGNTYEVILARPPPEDEEASPVWVVTNKGAEIEETANSLAAIRLGS